MINAYRQMNVSTIIIPVLVSAALTALMVPFILRLSYKKKLLDPLNERTVHSSPVPRLGGGAFILAAVVAVFLAVVISDGDELCCLLTDGDEVLRYAGLIGAALIIYFTGVWDDIRNLNYICKFVSQFVSAALVVFVGGFWINDLGGLFGFETMPAIWSQLASVVLIVFIINAFNLIDGIDGLAAALGIVATSILGIMFVIESQTFMAVLSFVMTASLGVFFCYNKFGSTQKQTKIFMGDGGSQTMGLIIAFLVVYISMRKCGESIVSVRESLVLSFSLIIIPCFDAIRVMLVRMYHGHNPFLADKTHIHHKLLRMGCGQTDTLLVILAVDALFICLNFLLMTSDINIADNIKINLILALDVVIWCAMHLYLNHHVRKAECKGSKE